jgi:Skp family chaperone for outer membrane proteins
MDKRIHLFALAALLSGASIVPPGAMAGSSQSLTVKMGYFNLNKVKTLHPASAGLDRLENTAKELLRLDAEKGNSALLQMQKDGKPKEEIEKAQRDLQLQINAKVEASTSLLMGNRATANTEIAQAVNAVAKEKGVDIIVDAGGIYAGGEKFLSNGEDLTDNILQKLVPTGILPTGQKAPATAK